MTEKRQCDICGAKGSSKTIHGLRTVKGSNDSMQMLCKKCWTGVMDWRRNKNITLQKFAKFPIQSWRN